MWSSGDLEIRRRESADIFRQERLEEPLEDYTDAFDRHRAECEELLEATVDLTRIDRIDAKVLADGNRRRVVRYLAGPPISEDDLKTLVGERVLSPTRFKKVPGLAKLVVDTVFTVIDPRRFVWLNDGREATEAERVAAVVATSSLMASQEVATKRRNEGKSSQEQRVKDALRDCGLEETPTRKIGSTSEGPGAGHYCGESMFGDHKADVVVGLWDNRLMPIECKVSNSEVNSFKRLNNEATAKAKAWTDDFGKLSVVPTVVLSGVFSLSNLEQAQGRGLSIFWGHRLDELKEFVEGTR